MKKILVIAVLLLAATSAFAAEEKKEDNIIKNIFETAVSPIDAVSKNLSEDSYKKDLGQIVVTPSGYREDAFNYPANVTVIGPEEIERSNARFVPDLLRQEPGLHVYDQTFTGKTTIVDMRGFGEQANRNVLVMVDGRRLNEIDNSGVDWAQIPIECVDRVEILRGSGSVLYGDNATAGVINIITKKGEGKPSIGYNYETGSYRLDKQVANISGGTKFMQYSGMGKYEYTDGYRLNGYYDGYDYESNATITPAEYLSINFSGAYHKDWTGRPGGLTRTQIDQIGRSGSTTPTDWAKTETGYFKISSVIELTKNIPDSSINIDFWEKKSRATSELHFGGGFFERDVLKIDTVGGTIKYLNGFDYKRIRNDLVLGTDLFHAENGIWSDPDQLYISKGTTGIYVSDKAVIMDSVILTGGYRYEWAKYTFNQEAFTSGYDVKSQEEKAIELGMEYKYMPRGALYGRFSRSYRFPATDEFFNRFAVPELNKNLKQQDAKTWEVGLKDESIKYLKTIVNFFLMDVDNEIYFNPMTFNSANYDKIQRRGVELEVKSDINKYVNIYFDYTFTNAFFKEGDFTGNKVPMVPTNKISWGVILSPLKYMIDKKL